MLKTSYELRVTRYVLHVARYELRAIPIPATRNAEPVTRLGFPGRINASGFLIGIGFTDKINRHIIADFPDFLGFQIAFKIGHGGTGDAVHDLVIQDTAANAAAL